MNPFSKIAQVGSETIGTFQFYETRLYYDEDDRLQYVCSSPIAQAAEDSETWFIKKLHYDGSSTRVSQVEMPIPTSGNTSLQGFIYRADLRATYFA